MSECVPGVRCTEAEGCTLALHHVSPCAFDGQPCDVCGAESWQACRMGAHDEPQDFCSDCGSPVEGFHACQKFIDAPPDSEPST